MMRDKLQVLWNGLRYSGSDAHFVVDAPDAEPSCGWR